MEIVQCSFANALDLYTPQYFNTNEKRLLRNWKNSACEDLIYNYNGDQSSNPRMARMQINFDNFDSDTDYSLLFEVEGFNDKYDPDDQSTFSENGRRYINFSLSSNDFQNKEGVNLKDQRFRLFFDAENFSAGFQVEAFSSWVRVNQKFNFNVCRIDFTDTSKSFKNAMYFKDGLNFYRYFDLQLFDTNWINLQDEELVNLEGNNILIRKEWAETETYLLNNLDKRQIAGLIEISKFDTILFNNRLCILNVEFVNEASINSVLDIKHYSILTVKYIDNDSSYQMFNSLQNNLLFDNDPENTILIDDNQTINII